MHSNIAFDALLPQEAQSADVGKGAMVIRKRGEAKGRPGTEHNRKMLQASLQHDMQALSSFAQEASALVSPRR